ncbi:NUMOD4 domain-containing protein [Cytobacillus horneckiae]|uniref:Endonuclease n=1 Tax=Cytobacillus horneckiae TaxID=549687 RepID=A0A2N0ZME2_9BACI|nr:NUMOD4 domain-containing protein [Cytobacillus horneckiae]MEC1155035.1 NUMOD4 domain-containing protein [Cytobacillus horneckiae]MED2936059.1 NUMOD4 domain-containing protein [Cytobacillus horneckiae]PKG30667.1 endonuclease [Cytobacillus horneckiae]
MEIWQDIAGYEGLYQVSNKGRVKSLLRKNIGSDGRNRTFKEKILKPISDRKGYFQVGLCKNGKAKMFLIHRLVSVAFIPNPNNKPEVNHKDGDKINNYASNLEWNTSRENIKHAFDTGLMKATVFIGEENPSSKLKVKEVRYIRENYIPRDKEFGTEALRKKFGVSQQNISKIVNFKVWKDII